MQGVRRIRSEMDIAPGKKLPVLLADGGSEDRQREQRNHRNLVVLGRLASIDWLGPNDPAPESAITLVGTLKILIPMAGLIDKQAEITRLEKEIAKRRQDLQRGEAKLNNPNFGQRAPAAVVAKERARVADLVAVIARLEEQREKIQRL